MATDENLLNRFRHVVKEQIKAIDELKAENERLKSAIEQSGDAMVVLQAIFTDESIKPEIRAAAAKAALAHQRPKVTVQAYANVTSLAARLDQGREAKLIEHDPKSAA